MQQTSEEDQARSRPTGRARTNKLSVFTLLLGTAVALLFLRYMTGEPQGVARLPDFSLQELSDPGREVDAEAMSGRLALVNFWASWCLACRTEHALLMELAADEQIPLYGINFIDNREDAIRWLDYYGDPYIISAHDVEGTLGHAMGTEALPATYLIGSDGKILFTYIGPLSRNILQQSIIPKTNQSEQSRE